MIEQTAVESRTSEGGVRRNGVHGHPDWLRHLTPVIPEPSTCQPIPLTPRGHQPATPSPLGAHTPTPTTSAHAQPTAATDAHDATLERDAQRIGWLRNAFYVAVLGVAMGGQVTGAVEALHIPLAAAIPATAALELGGVVVMATTDIRRRMGERATWGRLLSAACGTWAVAFNWLAHSNHLLGGFYAGFSALGYLVWLMRSENQRRDRLRAKGDLPPTTPAYELVGHWLRHPWITLRAKNLAKQSPGLGLYDSIKAAKVELRTERRNAAIAKVLHRKIRAAVDPTTADIAVSALPLDEIAAQIIRTADVNGVAQLVGEDLSPGRLGVSAEQVPIHVEAEVGAPIRPIDTPKPAQPKRQPTRKQGAQPSRRGRGRNTPTGRTARPHAQPTDTPTPSPPPTEGGLSEPMRTRLAQLAQEYPNVADVPGRDKAMAHMKAQGYPGWASKTTAEKAIAAYKASRETENGAPQ
jgi:hypothetical protein